MVINRLLHGEGLRRVYLKIQNFEVPRREGSDNYGFAYEHKLTALFSIRFSLLENFDEFWIASNVDHVGDFDDIVMSIKSKNGNSIAFMIQLKHKETEKLLQAQDFTYSKEEREGKRKRHKETFSIEKYWKGFEKFQEEYNKSEEDGDSEFIKELRKVDKFILILYTNKGVDDCNFLQKSNLSENFFDLLDTNQIQFCYSFDHNQLNYDCNFLQKMRLFASQLHVNDVDKLIEEELKKILGLSFPIMVNFNKVVEDYIKFVKTWIKGYKIEEETKYYTLTKQDVRNTLVGILFDSYKYDFGKEKFSSYDNNSGKLIWNQLMKDQVVTVINSHEKIVKFLQKYFGNEILKSIKNAPRTWGEMLVKKQQEKFYKHFGHSKVAQICQNADLSPLLIYKYLWMSGNLPLLLQINDGKNFGDILKILKVSKNIKVIVLVKNSNVSIPKHEFKIFSSLGDLTDEYQKQILDLNVSFQGRISVPLKDLVDKSMFGNLKCHDLIDIVSNNFIIGNKPSALIEYFISRSVSKVFLKMNVLNLENETFVIETNDTDATKEKLKELISKQLKIYFVSHRDNVRKRMKSSKGAIHRLECKDGYFEWKESLGDVSNLLIYKIETHDELYHSIVNENLEMFVTNKVINQVCVINGCPGMGKTTFLDFIALNVPKEFWVFKIKLTDLTVRRYDEEDDNEDSNKVLDNPEEILNFFERLISEDSEIENVPIALAVFKKFLKANKLMILLDGFDEISFLYKLEVTKIIKFLQEKDFMIFLTTREHMQKYLETTFKVLAINLKPFTAKEQETFLTTYFKANIPNSNESMVVEFVERLLKASKENLSDQDGEFTGIPLQTKLLADVFLKDCKKSLENNQIQLNERFDLLDLYQKFVNQKTKILCKKFGENERVTKKSVEEVQTLCALKCVFNSKDLKKFGIDEKLKSKSEDGELIQREGIVVVKINKKKELKIDFIHQTFAEYFVAKFLSKNCMSDDEQIKNKTLSLIEQRFYYLRYQEFLFLILDRILAKGRPLHLAIINLNYDQFKLEIEDNPNVLLETDDLERTGLHMLAIYGTDLYELKGDLEVYALVKTLNTSDLERMDVLCYNALDYCLCFETWTLIYILCSIAPLLNFRFFHGIPKDSSIEDILIPTVFHNYVVRDLFDGCIREDTLINDCWLKIEEYLNTSSSWYDYAEELNVATVSEYLKKVGLKCSERGTYNDIRFAVAFGSTANVEELFTLTDTDLNERDYNKGYTLLHYAIVRKRFDIFDFLLENGSDVNIADRNGNTAIHLAAWKGCDYVIENSTLNQTKNLNLENDLGETPLDYAIKFRHYQIAKILISNGGILYRRNFAILHDIAEAGDNDLLMELLKQNLDINYQIDSKTALHVALENNNLETAKLLIENNLNLSLDNADESFMHLIARIGNEELFNEFLLKGYDIDRQNKKGETPLLIALSYKHTELAKFIIFKGASVDAKSEFGTVLSEAIALGDEDIIRLLLEKGCDVNQKISEEKTPLLLAIESCKLNVTNLILKFNPDVTVTDDWGYTPLHLAALNGRFDLVEKLLEKEVEVDPLTICLRTPLLLALEKNHIEVAHLLISLNANVLIEDEDCRTPLHHAAEWGNISIVRNLIKRGAHDHINKVNSELHTPLSLALTNRHFETVNYLLSKGADLKVKLQRGETILHLAAETGNNHIIEECIKLNMDVNEKSRRKELPLFRAISANKIESAELLIEKGADIYALDNYQNSILHLLAETGNDDFLLKMLNLNCDLNAVNDFLETPLCVALQYRNLNTARLLLERDAKIDILCEDGRNTLHLAANCGYKELVIKCLKETNFDVNKLDDEGLSPLDYAIESGNTETITALLENGAQVTVSCVSKLFCVFVSRIESKEELSTVGEILKQFLKRCHNINVIDEEENTILHLIITSYNKAKEDQRLQLEKISNLAEEFFELTLKSLVIYGADLRIRNCDGKSSSDLIYDNNLSHYL